MTHARNRPGALLLVVGFVLALSAGASAFTLIDFEFPTFSGFSLGAGATFRHVFAGLRKTGYSIRSADGSALTLSGDSRFDPADVWQAGTRVQEGFILLDGTLSLELVAEKEGGARAGARTTYRLDLDRTALQRRTITRKLRQQRVVLDSDEARTRARFVGARDARVMRHVVRNGEARWVRAVRVLATPDRVRFRSRRPPTGVLGHFGFDRSDEGDVYVWAVMDRNSRYAIGLTVDRDNDGRPNSVDNCIGTPNANQANADGDQAGDACDVDDDNDAVLDAADNCPLAANAGQEDFDGDGNGNACDLDDDNDRVVDGDDQCLATVFGSIVNRTGCSIDDQCPCDSEWRNHGAYVKCVARTSELFVRDGLITFVQKDAIVSSGAKSSCGS
jgi:hypothetical protein